MAQPRSEEAETYFLPIVKNTFIDLEQVSDGRQRLRRCLSEPAWYSTCVESGSEEGDAESQPFELADQADDSPNQTIQAWGHQHGHQEALGSPGTMVVVRQDACSSNDPALVPALQVETASESAGDLPGQEDLEEPEAPVIPMAQLHQLGRCVPCLYHTRKRDGCRKGSACRHCHICTTQEARRRRNRIHLEKRKDAKARARLQDENAEDEDEKDDQ
eukprot:s687_g28.t1